MLALRLPQPLVPLRGALPWLALLAAAAFAAQCGAVPIAAEDWWALLRGDDASGVLWNLRLPRVALALAVGAALGLAGALTQGLFRNPLADPGLLGITSGAACAVALLLTVAASLPQKLPPEWRMFALPVAAFVGALACCALLERSARWLTPGSVTGLLLAGLALNAIAMSVVGLCTFLATDEQLRSLSFWTLGSLAGGSWAVVLILAAALLLARALQPRFATQLNALALGEGVATQLGVDVARLRRRLIALVALLAGLAVAWCGSIGFIGLMAPHAARLVVGADQSRLLPASMFAGALLLLLADTAARTWLIPAELPVGILTALLGGPCFLVLLRGGRG